MPITLTLEDEMVQTIMTTTLKEHYTVLVKEQKNLKKKTKKLKPSELQDLQYNQSIIDAIKVLYDFYAGQEL